MIGVMYITGFINTMYTILRNEAMRLRTKSINTCHIIHVLRIMMDEIGMYGVITHTPHSAVPTPSQTNGCIRNLTDRIMCNINITNKSGTDSMCSPVFISHISDIIIHYIQSAAHFTFICRIIR